MKLGVFFLTFAPLRNEGCTSLDMADIALSEGLSYVELSPFDDMQTVEDAARFSRYAKNLGLTVSCFSAGIDVLGEGAEENVAKAKRFIDMCEILGSPFFHQTIHPSLKHPSVQNIAFEDALEEATMRLKDICAYAATKDITVLLEDQGMYFNGVENMKKLVSALGDTRYGFVLDTGNIFFVDEKPEDYLLAFTDKIMHVHLKDYAYVKEDDMRDGIYTTMSGKRIIDVEPGTGEVDFKRISEILKDAGYDGTFSIEYCGKAPLEKAVPSAIKYFTDIFGA